MAGSKPGEHRGGRRRGTPNKLTAEAKCAIELAFKGIGGVPSLQTWAKANPGEFYTKVWVKVLPLQVTGKDDAPLIPPGSSFAFIVQQSPESENRT